MTIQSVQRVSDILSLFSIENPRWRITEIANTLNLPITTVSGLVRTMTITGLLEQERHSRQYGLGSKLFTLGIVANDTLEINQIAGVPVQQMADNIGLICRVSIWDHDAALVTIDASPRDADFLSRRIGPRVVAYCSSSGRVLLANLDKIEIERYLKEVKLTRLTPFTITRKDQLRRELKKIKMQGYAVNNQELRVGFASIAVPVFSNSDQVEASISVVGTPDYLIDSEFDNLLYILRSTADEISWKLGYHPEAARSPLDPNKR